MMNLVTGESQEWQETILSRLKAFNRTKCRWLREHSDDSLTRINFFAIDDGILKGGAIGHMEYNWYLLDLLWVDEDCHGAGIGTALLRQVEEYARRQGLVGIRLETWDFQARGFYEKSGFKVFGSLDDCPPGATVFFMKKMLCQ